MYIIAVRAVNAVAVFTYTGLKTFQFLITLDRECNGFRKLTTSQGVNCVAAYKWQGCELHKAVQNVLVQRGTRAYFAT